MVIFQFVMFQNYGKSLFSSWIYPFSYVCLPEGNKQWMVAKSRTSWELLGNYEPLGLQCNHEKNHLPIGWVVESFELLAISGE